MSLYLVHHFRDILYVIFYKRILNNKELLNYNQEQDEEQDVPFNLK